MYLKGEISGDLKGDPQKEIVPDVNIIRSKVSDSGTNHKILLENHTPKDTKTILKMGRLQSVRTRIGHKYHLQQLKSSLQRHQAKPSLIVIKSKVPTLGYLNFDRIPPQKTCPHLRRF